MTGRYKDPVTGDELTAGEWVSWRIQHVMRRWSFLGMIVLATFVCWLTNNTAVLTWWNLAASLAALLIEGITAMALINQTLRDAVVSRSVRTMEEEHGKLLADIHWHTCGKPYVLNESQPTNNDGRPARDPRTGRYVKHGAANPHKS